MTLQGIKFKIPEGYSEIEDKRELGAKNEAGDYSSSCLFANGDKNITIAVTYSNDGELGNFQPTTEGVVNKTISSIEGFFLDAGDEVSFTYVTNGKIISISAPDENTITQIIK